MTDYDAVARAQGDGAPSANDRDPLDTAGLLALTAGADLGDVAACLRELVRLVTGLDALDRRVQRDRAVARLKEIRIADASRLVDAALGGPSESLAPAVASAEQNPATLWELGRPVLEAPDILARVARYVVAHGYAGDTRAPQLVYLAMTSRLLERPVNLFLAGPSAGGKNFTVRVVCPLFPPEAYYAVAGMSPLAVMYSPESFEHRTIVISEAAAFHEGGIGASLLRGLAWDAELKYDTVIDGESVRLHKAGPTGLITTGTRKLEPELATRLWTVPVPDDPTHTRAVLQATALEVAGLGHQAEAAPEDLVAAQRWLAVAGLRVVVVPFASELAELVPVHEVRMRRDFTQLLTLIRAHALLHQQHRDRDERGRVVATLGDYAAVHDIVQPVFSASLSAGLTQEIRDTAHAVRDLTLGVNTTVTVTQVADRLHLSPSATWRRVRGALEGRWLVNEESRKHQPAKLRVGEPMPDVPGLPAPLELTQTCKRTTQPLGESADGRLHGRLQASREVAQMLSDVEADAAEGVGPPPDFLDGPLPEPPGDEDLSQPGGHRGGRAGAAEAERGGATARGGNGEMSEGEPEANSSKGMAYHRALHSFLDVGPGLEKDIPLPPA